LPVNCVHKHLRYIFIVWGGLTQLDYLVDISAFDREIFRWF
jgi:hypothetical protein